MRSSVCPALPTASVVRGLRRDHDRRRGQRCTVLNYPVSLINRGKLVQRNRATYFLAAEKAVLAMKLEKTLQLKLSTKSVPLGFALPKLMS